MSEEIEHSPRGPSGAHRWRRCPGSINAERGLPDKVGREAAVGTIFHKYAALCVQHDLDPHDFNTGMVYVQDGHTVTFDAEMQDSMYAGLDWIRDHYQPEADDLIYVETRVDISPWAGDGEFGTSDVAIIKRRKRHIIIFDWKYGKGVPVSPVRNDQMYLYTLGVWNTVAKHHFNSDPHDIKVTFLIEQPRHFGGGGEWETTMAEVLTEGAQIRLDAAETMNPNALRIPGEKQCLFCKASGRCKEQAAYLLQAYGQKYADIKEGDEPQFEDPEEVDPEVRSFVILHWKAFKRWYDQLRVLAIRDIAAGQTVPLLKAVTGRPGHRKYKPVYEAEVKEELTALLGEKAFVTTMITPAVAEKQLGKKTYKAHIAAYVEQPPGKVQLVPLDDKREPIQNLASKYAELDANSEGEDDGED